MNYFHSERWMKDEWKKEENEWWMKYEWNMKDEWNMIDEKCTECIFNCPILFKK